MLGPYQVLSKIGEGGMGEVYSARDSKLGRKVALKILPELFARDPERLARFEREARLLAALNHSNIATLYGLERTDDHSVLVMELVEGDTLADRVARGPLPVEAALTIARQIVEALESAHASGIVHRDLKPANVKVTPDSKVKVLDFGLAKALTTPQAQQDLLSSPTVTAPGTYAGMILGTAPYMAPEQAKGQDVDARADVFSFGCVLFELLTGRRSFPGNSVTEAIASVLAREADLSLLPPNIHPGVGSLLRRCLEKDPARRWQAIGDVRVELDTLLQDPHGANVPKAQPQPQSWRLVLGAIVATAVVVAGVTTAIVRSLQPAAAPRPLVRFAYVLPRDQSFTRTGRHVMTIAPDGNAIAYVANNQLYLKSMSDMEAKAVPGTNQDINTPVFSPDGQSVVFCAVTEGKLKRIAIAGGTSVTLASINNPYGIDWYADNAMLVGQGSAGIVRISNSANGKPETVIAVKPGELAAMPQMLPDGQTVLYTIAQSISTTDWDKAQIVAESLTSHKRTLLVDGGSDGRYVSTGHIVYAVGNSVFAVPFDAGALKVAGSPVPVVEDVSRASCCTGASFFAISKTGSLATIPGSAASLRVLALVQPNGDRKLLDFPAATYTTFSVAPHDDRFAVTVYDKEAANIWIGSASDKSGLRRLTFGGSNNFTPLWTPDGKRIVFHSDRDSPGSFALYWQPADGSGTAERLTAPGPGESHQAGSWSADGKVLSLQIQTTGAGDTIAMLALDGDRKPKPLIAAPGDNVWAPRFSPDGRWIAYSSSESTLPEVYVQPYPPTGAKYLITPQGGEGPIWSRDGTRLFYLGHNTASGGTAGLTPPRIMAVDVHTQQGFTHGQPVPLPIEVSSWSYALMPDGKQFLVSLSRSETETGSSTPLQISVVLNWFEELKRRKSKE